MKWISSKQAAELGKSLAAIVLALVIGALFILVAGESPATAYSSLLKGALGTPQAVFFLCSFVCKSGCQKFCIRKIPFDFVSNILSGCIYIVDNSTLNISLKSLGVGISSDREQRIIYL